MINDDDHITTARRLELIQAAVDECAATKERWKEIEKDPRSSSADRAHAKAALMAAENRFGWQWQNVQSLLNDHAIKLAKPKSEVVNHDGVIAHTSLRIANPDRKTNFNFCPICKDWFENMSSSEA